MIVRQVTTGRHRRDFIRLPWKIYGSDRNWVPPLIRERRDFMNQGKNPFFDHSKVRFFLAADEGGSVLGRIAAIVNYNHISIHNEKVGFWGLFETVNDGAVARSLFDAAARFLREEGMEVMRGPENMCINDEVGLLIRGFDTPPMILMSHNPPYYEQLVEGYGFAKVMDLYAYYGEVNFARIPERLTNGVGLVQQKWKFTVRGARMKEFDAEVAAIHKVYTSAWEANWGAVAMTDREFAHLAGNLRSIIDPDLCLIAEVNGEIAGFSLALPNYNQVLIHLNGRLFPFGVVRLPYLRRRIDAVRVITAGVLKKFRRMGIDTFMYYEIYRRAIAKGIGRGEMSWVLENNTMMNRSLQNLGFTVYKTYRLYDYRL